MDPMELPALADKATFTVKRALAAQLLKSIVAVTVAFAAGARFPAAIGSAVLSRGVQAAPPACVNVMPLTSAPTAAAGPLLLT